MTKKSIEETSGVTRVAVWQTKKTTTAHHGSLMNESLHLTTRMTKLNTAVVHKRAARGAHLFLWPECHFQSRSCWPPSSQDANSLECPFWKCMLISCQQPPGASQPAGWKRCGTTCLTRTTRSTLQCGVASMHCPFIHISEKQLCKNDNKKDNR